MRVLLRFYEEMVRARRLVYQDERREGLVEEVLMNIALQDMSNSAHEDM